MPHTVTAPEFWTDENLNKMRTVGDPASDAAIDFWQTKYAGGDKTLRSLANKLVGFECASEVDRLIDLLVAQAPHFANVLDPRARVVDCSCTKWELSEGYELFQEHGLKILMILVFYSLPASYAAQNGVRVLHSESGSTGFLVEDLNRRLIETTQFVLEIFAPGGLSIAASGSAAEHGPAVLAALRVRLLHSSVRALIQGPHVPPPHIPPWNKEKLGVPANQEDAAGTLLVFSWIVIDGLRKLHLDVDPKREEAYFQIWRKVGRLLGIDELLIPTNVAEADILMKRIKARQIDAPIDAHSANKLGSEMTQQLLDFIRHSLPWPLHVFRRLPASVMRFFLPANVSKSLGVPRTYGLDEFVRLWFFIEARITKYRFFDALNRLVFKEWGGRDPRARAFLQFSRFFNRRLVEHMKRVNRNKVLIVHKPKAHIDLMGWDDAWDFQQASFLTRPVRRVIRRWNAR